MVWLPWLTRRGRGFSFLWQAFGLDSRCRDPLSLRVLINPRCRACRCFGASASCPPACEGDSLHGNGCQCIAAFLGYVDAHMVEDLTQPVVPANAGRASRLKTNASGPAWLRSVFGNRKHTMPILITLLVTAPILALGTWLYLRRRAFSPRLRILLLSVVFLFVLISGPAIFLMWHHGGMTGEILATGRGGRQLLGQIPLLWLI